MGVEGFYKWVEAQGYVPTKVYPNSTDSFVVDTKALMYKKASSIPITCENYAKEIADKIAATFIKFPNVLFVNDGNKTIPQMKCVTLEKRRKTQANAQKKAEEGNHELDELKNKKQKRYEEATTPEEKELFEKTQLIEDLSFALKEEKVEKQARAARGVSTSTSMEVLHLLSEMGFKTLQCEGEADPVLVDMSTKYTYVISEDSDLLVSGITNLLRFFGSKNLLYNSCDILEKAKLNAEQLKQMVCMSGCDYTSGLNQMGLKTADKLMRKYKNFDQIMKFLDVKKHSPCTDFTCIVQKACLLFNGQQKQEELQKELVGDNEI